MEASDHCSYAQPIKYIMMHLSPNAPKNTWALFLQQLNLGSPKTLLPSFPPPPYVWICHGTSNQVLKINTNIQLASMQLHFLCFYTVCVIMFRFIAVTHINLLILLYESLRCREKVEREMGDMKTQFGLRMEPKIKWKLPRPNLKLFLTVSCRHPWTRV